MLAQMAAIFRQFRCSIVAIEEVPEEEVGRYGVIASEAITERIFRVTDMVEKPRPGEAPSNLAIVGRYILTPDIFAILETTPKGEGGELQLTDALLAQAEQGAVLAYRFKGAPL